jgi:hypothetical protein
LNLKQSNDQVAGIDFYVQKHKKNCGDSSHWLLEGCAINIITNNNHLWVASVVRQLFCSAPLLCVASSASDPVGRSRDPVGRSRDPVGRSRDSRRKIPSEDPVGRSRRKIPRSRRKVPSQVDKRCHPSVARWSEDTGRSVLWCHVLSSILKLPTSKCKSFL